MLSLLAAIELSKIPSRSFLGSRFIGDMFRANFTHCYPGNKLYLVVDTLDRTDRGMI